MKDDISGFDGIKEISAKEILGKIERGEPVEYNGVIIKGDPGLNNLLLEGDEKFLIKFPIKIINSYIDCILNFSKANFKGSFNFQSTVFGRNVKFNECRFSEDFNFIGSQFNENSEFVSSQFDGNISFNGSQFDGDVKFAESIFLGNSDFTGSHFNGNSAFSGSEFRKDANFKDCRFRKDANFIRSQFRENANFRDSWFEEHLNFRNTDFGGDVSFRESQLGKFAYFFESYFGGSANFFASLFAGKSDFFGSQFKGNANFRDSQFIGDVSFKESQFSKDANFRKATFGGDTNFEGCQFGQDALFEKAKFEKIGGLYLTRSRFQKLYLRYQCIRGALSYNDEAYLSLVENYKKIGWLEDADECYYCYRTKHQIGDPIRRLFDLAARYSYGYGTKPERPLVISASIILISSFIFLHSTDYIVMMQTNKTMSFGDALFFSAITFTSGASQLINASSANFSTEGYLVYVFTLERLLGWIFFVLFLASIGRTIIR